MAGDTASIGATHGDIAAHGIGTTHGNSEALMASTNALVSATLMASAQATAASTPHGISTEDSSGATIASAHP